MARHDVPDPHDWVLHAQVEPKAPFPAATRDERRGILQRETRDERVVLNNVFCSSSAGIFHHKIGVRSPHIRQSPIALGHLHPVRSLMHVCVAAVLMQRARRQEQPQR